MGHTGRLRGSQERPRESLGSDPSLPPTTRGQWMCVWGLPCYRGLGVGSSPELTEICPLGLQNQMRPPPLPSTTLLASGNSLFPKASRPWWLLRPTVAASAPRSAGPPVGSVVGSTWQSLVFPRRDQPKFPGRSRVTICRPPRSPCQPWWCEPLILAPGRQRQAILCAVESRS